MQSFYDLQMLADYRIQQRRAQADTERLAERARRAQAVMAGHSSPALVGGVLRIRSCIDRMRAILAKEDHPLASPA